MDSPEILVSSRGYTFSLFEAIQEKKIHLVKLLLKLRESPAILGEAFVECVSNVVLKTKAEDTSRCELLNVMLQHGADVNLQSCRYQGMTAAMLAAKWGFFECLCFLVKSGADLSLVSLHGETALTAAVKTGQDDCVQYIAQRVSVSALNHIDKFGSSVLMQAVSTPTERKRQCVQHLIAAGADVNLQNEDGDTALMVAIRCRFRVSAVSLLLDEGAHVNTVTVYGETPLALALNKIENDRGCGTVQRLLQLGADPTLSRRQRDCLHKKIISRRRFSAIIRVLVMSGLPPLEIPFESIRQFEDSNSLMMGMSDHPDLLSPLAMALLCDRSDIARYFIANAYFTRFDIVHLCWDENIRDALEYGQNELFEGDGSLQPLDILDFLAANPQSLFILSLVAVSSALSKDLICDHPKSSVPQWDKYRWTFKPTFRERVECLGLPPALKRALLHKTPSSKICSRYWNGIPLDQSADTAKCECPHCKDSLNLEA